MMNNNTTTTTTITTISRNEHKNLFENLVTAMREYAQAINTARNDEVELANESLQEAAQEFLSPYGMKVGAAFMAMVHADVTLKKDENGERVFSVPSGATVRKYLKTEVFPRFGLVWQSCVKVGEKKARKSNKVDFGTMTVEDAVNGMSAEKFAEFAAACAARAARAEKTAA